MKLVLKIARSNSSFLISLFIILSVIRVIEFTTVNFIGEEQPSIQFLFTGIVFDFFLSLIVYGISVFFQLVLFPLGIRKSIVLPVFAILVILLTFGMYVFFKKANVPLDESIFLFSWEEILMISNPKANFSWGILIGIVALVSSFFFLETLFARIKLSERTIKTILFCSVVSLLCSPFAYFTSKEKTSTVFINNRLVYFIGRSINYFKTEGDFAVFEKEFTLADFKGLHRDFYHGGEKEYPLMHTLNEKSVLADHFHKKGTNPPNIVFIIIESLSSDFIGKRSDETGNFLPFLNELSRKSLYFPNFLSTCQRTFNVLPASLSSIPNSTNGAYTTSEEFTPQLSLPLLLDKMYHSRFYCGVRLNYNNMDAYLNNLNMNYLVANWDEKYNRKFSETPNTWGYPDGFLFDKSWGDLKVQNLAEKPRFDVFLTISTHDPFSFPNENYYTRKSIARKKDGRMSKVVKEQLLSDKYIMASFAYTDDAVKKYFQEARKKPEFDNTIFFIYGDHGSPFYARNPLSKFNVPLIIYSPLLKKSKTINAVSTQLDLAPTIIQFLKQEYGMDLPEEIPFVGKQLDMNEEFRVHRSLALLSSNGINEGIIHENSALINGKCYTLKPDLELKEINNPAKERKLSHQLELYENLSRYCFYNKKIVPAPVYQKYDLLKKKLFIDPKGKLKYKFLAQKVNNFEGATSKETEVKFCDNFQIDPSTRSIRFVCYVDWFLESQSQMDSLPQLILTGSNTYAKRDGTVFWKPTLPRLMDKFKPNAYNRLRFENEIDLQKYKRLKKKNKLRFFLSNLKNEKLRIKTVKTIFYVY